MNTSNFNLNRFTEHFRMMHRIRAFEEASIRALEEKLVLGAIHPSIGQEAIAAGVSGNLRKDDIMLTTHRGHGHTMAKGVDALAMMRELLGRSGGTSGGKGGSMHIADFEHGMLGANGVVGANIVIATGAAHAIRIHNLTQKDDRVVVCFFGDGATNRGPFLEGLNWAGVFDLPILFVCEDNGFAATTRTRAMTSGAGPAARAEALGIPTQTVDGNDLVALDALATTTIAALRSGSGPRAIVAKTYRLTGHTASDAALYREAAEVEEKWRDDPIARLRQRLEDAGASSVNLDKIVEQAQAEMAKALDDARASDWPDPSLAFADVQDAGSPEGRAY
jgi:acetoin:2,6-dichlorophenolindophenol oxidoreductase subunit alpha